MCLCFSDAGEDLYSRLQQLQSHFTWDLKKEDLELEQQDEDQELGQQRAVAHSCCFLAYVRYRTEAVSTQKLFQSVFQ